MDVANKVIAWQKKHGRHDLPWQVNPTAYHVWVSEVMLQQTQVKTVIPYYMRFMNKCPTVADLAQLSVDELMSLWQGLGYYSRARHLHKAAKMIVLDYAGVFPTTHKSLLSLPGIGRSTAAAIMSLAYNQPDAILDGNVKRVLCRYHAVQDNPKGAKTLKQLWVYAESHLSDEDPRAFTQGMMDLGANICKRSNPICTHCPLQEKCRAYQLNLVSKIPIKSPKKPPKPMDLYVLLVIDGDKLGLIKRPKHGIWAQLYTPLIFEGYEALYRHQSDIKALPTYRHQLTHLSLTIHPFVTNNKCLSIDCWEPISAINVAIPTGIRPSIALLQEWLEYLDE